MLNYAIALDVGGTSVKVGIIDPEFNLLDEAIKSYPSKADKDAETIIDNFLMIIYDQWERVKDSECTIGSLNFGFPGPFDYEKGISYMKGIAKYDSIYGINLAKVLRNRLISDGIIRFADKFPILFENDATVFALGEYYAGKAVGCDRVMCITLGTGCGSTFLDKGRVVKGESGIPASGMIFDQPFRDGTVDHYISRRSILRLAEKKGFDKKIDAGELDNLAREGNAEAAEVYYEFGLVLGEALASYIQRFNPDIIVLGGGISKGYDLFSEGMKKQLPACSVRISISDNLSRSALIGAASLTFKKRV